jgi:hypothetical protein
LSGACDTRPVIVSVHRAADVDVVVVADVDADVVVDVDAAAAVVPLGDAESASVAAFQTLFRSSYTSVSVN